ncbi:MAG TPA: hypothetical protein DCO93_05645 [Clostridiales bacterium]|nr:hypothetical protein [Clostridiales bacterium]
MKKALSFVLSLSLIFPTLLGIVSAKAENIPAIGIEGSLCKGESQKHMGGFLPDKPMQLDVSIKSSSRGRFNLKSAPTQNVYEYLEEQMKNHEKNIVLYPTYEVRAYYEFDEEKQSTYISLDNFHTILRTVLFNNYDILVYDNPYNCNIAQDNEGNLYIGSFSPEYYISEEDEQSAVEMMDNEINNYLEAVRDIPSNDVVGKMVVIHDLLCANNVYDTEGLNNEQTNGISCNYARTAYNMFANNMGVCQGYAMALKAIYDKLNKELKEERGTTEEIIETSFCSSDNIAHIWNVVKIDGNWYHIDLTWDDIDYNEETPIQSAWHGYFLKTDSEFASDHFKYDGNDQPIYDWAFYTNQEVNCYDSKYSQGHIFNLRYAYLISYSDGAYNIDLGYTLRTDSTLLTDILTTDSFLYEYKQTEESEPVVYNAIMVFTEEPIIIRQILTSYDENGALMANKCVIPENMTIGGSYNFTPLIYDNSSPSRVFIWSPDSIKPLCRAIYVPALVQ